MSLAIRLVVMLKFYCFSSMIRFLFSVTSAPTLFYQEKSEIILNIKSIFDRDMKMRHQMSDNRMISLFCVKIWIMLKSNEGEGWGIASVSIFFSAMAFSGIPFAQTKKIKKWRGPQKWKNPKKLRKSTTIETIQNMKLISKMKIS